MLICKNYNLIFNIKGLIYLILYNTVNIDTISAQQLNNFSFQTKLAK